MYSAIELQPKLMEAQGKNTDSSRIRPYTASTRFGKDVESLCKIGMTPEDISYSLSVPLTYIRKQKLRIAKANEERRKFLTTGILSEPGAGVFHILQR